MHSITSIPKLYPRPVPDYSWVSVLACAQWDLKQAEEAGDAGRIVELKTTIATATERIRTGVLYASTQGLVSRLGTLYA